MKYTIIISKVFILLLLTYLYGEVPRIMNYQAKLTDDAGIAVSDTNRTIAFMIYNTESGGSPLWAETLSVNITKGLFDVQLGEVHSLNIPFDAPYWIELKVDQNDDGDVTDPTDETLEPREKLAAVSYAFRAIYSDTAEFSENAVAGITEEELQLGREGQTSRMKSIVTDCSSLPGGTWLSRTIDGHNFCIQQNAMFRTYHAGWYTAQDICHDLGARLCARGEYVEACNAGVINHLNTWEWVGALRPYGSSTWTAKVVGSGGCTANSDGGLNGMYQFRCCATRE